MNTPAHLIAGAAFFGKTGQKWITLAALTGAFIPDASLYFMAGIALFVLEMDPDYVFGTLYFSDEWQQVFAVDNSFILWGIALAFAAWWGRGWMIALTGAALLHLAADFPLHSHDARMHFWPLSDWKFISPISYWDSDHGGSWVGPLEMVLVVGMTIWCWRTYSEWWLRIVVTGLCLMQLIPFVSWYLFF